MGRFKAAWAFACSSLQGNPRSSKKSIKLPFQILEMGEKQLVYKQRPDKKLQNQALRCKITSSWTEEVVINLSKSLPTTDW